MRGGPRLKRRQPATHMSPPCTECGEKHHVQSTWLPATWYCVECDVRFTQIG